RDELDSADGREEWMYDFDRTSLAGHRGQCHLRLGQSAQAIAAFNDGLDELPPGHDRRRAQLGLGLAHAHLDACDPEVALSHVLAALDTFTAMGSTSGVRRVRRPRDLFRTTGHRTAADELDGRVRTYLRSAP